MYFALELGMGTGPENFQENYFYYMGNFLLINLRCFKGIFQELGFIGYLYRMILIFSGT